MAQVNQLNNTQSDIHQSLIDLITNLMVYNIQKVNNYDTTLMDYGDKIGLDSTANIALFMAEKRKDVEGLLYKYKKYNYINLMNILRLKKASAEKRFRDNYGISNNLPIGSFLGVSYGM